MTPRPWPKRQWPEAVPRFVTPRNFARRTIGPELVEVARALSFEPMPWNVDNWDTMGELDDDGMLWYAEARITVPRQSSKSLSTLVRHVHRMLRSEALGWGARPVSACTAQTASDARKMMTQEWQPIVANAGLPEWKRNLIGNGTERIEWQNGGRIGVFPPTQTGAHGSTLDAVDLDECFAFVDARAEQGARPAMITRPSRQLVIQSTAGTAESTYLRAKVDDGRARVESGVDGRVYYLEYSAGPDDDVDNPEHWPRWMPALGYTQTLEALTIEHDTISADDWYRAFCNGWTGSKTSIFPAALWAQAFSPERLPA